MADEISAYIDECYKAEQGEKLKDVYVTDHSSPDIKYLSKSEEEDEDLYAYQKSIDEYNDDNSAGAVYTPKAPIYPKSSMMQKLFDPFAESTRNEDGTIIYNLEEKELVGYSLDDEAVMRAQYEQAKSKQEVWDVDAEDEDSFRLAMLQELEEGNAGFNVEDFHASLDKELGVFAKGEKYSFVKDLKDAHRSSLTTNLEDKILDTIPDHVFWDIKKPINQRKDITTNGNRYNPFRGREYDNFFEMRDSEDYKERMETKRNVNDSISMFRRY